MVEARAASGLQGGTAPATSTAKATPTATVTAYGRFPLAEHFGFEIGYPEDRCEVRFEARAHLLNPRGALHGGAISLACDTAMGHLLHRQGWVGVTLELQMRYLHPPGPGAVLVKAHVVRKGGSIATMRADVFGADRELAAVSYGTFKRVRGDGSAAR